MQWHKQRERFWFRSSWDVCGSEARSNCTVSSIPLGFLTRRQPKSPIVQIPLKHSDGSVWDTGMWKRKEAEKGKDEGKAFRGNRGNRKRRQSQHSPSAMTSLIHTDDNFLSESRRTSSTDGQCVTNVNTGCISVLYW